jgi:DNA-binding XRE family transcriptional regulator
VNALTAEVLATRRLPPPALRKAIRQGAGVSQARMAKELGVHRMTILRWECSREPRGDLRRRYTALLEELRAVVES